MAWPQANGICKHHNKTLVVMETEQEWEFIKNAIQNRVGSKYGEWFIGLVKDMTTKNWTWSMANLWLLTNGRGQILTQLTITG